MPDKLTANPFMKTNSSASTAQLPLAPAAAPQSLATVPPPAQATRSTGKPSALVVMASRLSVEPEKLLNTLKHTVFKGASDEEMLALVVVANEYGLNPLLKELYAFPNKGGGIVPMVPIDGWTKIVNRQPDFDGMEFEFADDDKGKPFSCTCVLYIKERSKPLRVTEFYAECYRNTDPWNKMPRRMLRHKAYMQAARLAFGLSGIFDEDEAGDQAERAPVRVVETAAPPTLPATATVVSNSNDVLGRTTVGAGSSPAPTASPVAIDPQTAAEAAMILVETLFVEHGLDETEFLTWAKAQKFAPPTCQTVGDLPLETLKRFLANLPALAAQVKAAGEPTPPAPAA